MRTAILRRVPGHVNQRLNKYIGYSVMILKVDADRRRASPDKYIYVRIVKNPKLEFWCSEIDLNVQRERDE